ncbi:protein lin-54 homolog [Topomyia yanbarensis]|uniref:protein lin-54 homolog n=1 Tax=Topomyia yanbarensis TaxID=2498891 RepID=UPI00273BE61C|nr:protein lin-54 homolog [Topomyia yanbarensis]
MEVEEDYTLDDGMEGFGMHTLEEGTFVGSDDLVEYSAGEDEQYDEVGYIKSEESLEDGIPRSVINSPNITVKRVVNSNTAKPVPTILQKVAPKASQVIRTTNATGKVVLIQRPPSSVAPVKLLNNVKTTPASTKTTSYHLVKNDGSVMMRSKVTPQAMVRRVVSAAETSTTPRTKVIAKAPTHVVIHTKSGTAGTTTKTVTVAEAHQMGLLNNKMKQMVAVAKPKPTGPLAAKSPVKILPSSSTGVQSGSNLVRLKQSPGAPGPSGQTHKVLIKSNLAATNKTAVHSQKVLLPQSAIQAGQQSGQIQAINIPGKGIQYVRFLNQHSSSTTSAGPGRKIVQVVNKPSNTATTSGSKIIMQNAKTYVVSNGNVTTVRAAGNSQQIRAVPSGSQTLVRKAIVSTEGSQIGVIKREPDSSRYITLVRKEDNSSEAVTTLTASQLNHLKGSSVMAGGSKTKIVMVPSDYTRQVKIENSYVGTGSTSATMSNPPTIISVKRESISGSDDEARKGPSIGSAFPDEAYKKRPCNCTKSQCLKLYCDCFANGEFCYNCNCRDCYNNLDNEEERQKAIRATLERNPSAFKPKVCAVSAAEDSLRQHTKGCNCKRSGCLKNYCECYEAKIPCSGNCKCIGCRNTEQFAKEYEYATGLSSSVIAAGCESGAALGIDPDHLSGDDSMAEAGQASSSLGAPVAILSGVGECSTSAGVKRPLPAEPDLTQLPPSKQPYNFMTPDVIEATVQCMIAQADECQKRGCNIRTAERMILEEFGRCLVEIIDFSTKSDS